MGKTHFGHCSVFTALVSESISVIHITDDDMSIIQPREITETHVVVDTPHLSAFGIVWDVINRFMNFMTKPVSGQVLLFLRPTYRGGNLILSVLLLPSNVPLQEVKPSSHHRSPSVQTSNYLLFLISHKSGLLITTKALYSICLLPHHSLLWRVIVMP